MNQYLIVTAAVCVLTACATAPPGFPPVAQPITAKALHERLVGKNYLGQTAKGQGWDIHYAADGRLQMRVSSGESDQGRWRTEDNRLCVDFEGKFPSGCSEMRADTGRLYLQRVSTGEIVVLTPKP